MSEVEDTVTGPLDLGDADVKGFAPIDPGRYKGEIADLVWDAVKNAGGKMPVGTPMLKITSRVHQPKIDNEVIDQDRLVWAQYIVPPKDYDPRKRATMLGMIARFFMSLGFTEEQVKASSFNPNFEDLKGQEVVVVVGREPKKDRDGRVVEGEFNNPVKGFKSIDTWADAEGTASGSGLL